MYHRIRGLRFVCLLLSAGAIVFALAACGSSSSSSGDANTLLRQTFGGTHTVNSGNLTFSLTVNPSGSRTLTGPITFSFGGPFQTRGKGQLPESNFTISISAQGHTGSLGIVSTGNNGYVTLQGTSYQLPAATFQKLESSFGQVASSSGGGSNGGALAKLGIDPMHWLVNPSVVGHESISGAETTHIRAGVNVDALLKDINTFLQKASALGVTGAGKLPSSISDATRSKIAGEVKNPTVDVWTGSSDKTVRRLAIQLTLPVSGTVSSLLGGLSSAQIGLSMQYANLNQPQSIQAPATVRPFSEFTTKLRAFLASVQGVAGSPLSGGATGSGSAAPGAGSAAKLQRYSQCITAAGQNVAKMQRCAGVLNGK